MCDDEKIKLFDSVEGLQDVGFYVWIRFLLQAGKVNDNGLIYLKPNIPYTKQMLARIFERPVDIIEKVMEVLVEFQMIEIYEDGIIKICNWEKHQNIEGMKKVREDNKERVKNCRERKKEKEFLKKEALEEEERKKFSESAKEELSEGKTNKGKVTIKNAAEEKVNNNGNKSLEKIQEKKFNNTEVKEIGHLSNEEILQEEKNINKKSKNKNCNTNVTLQREKREEDKENKKKNIDKKEREEIDKEALKVIGDLEKINKNIKGLSLSWVKDKLTTHEEKYVKMAMGKALEKNKLDINCINGILNNWLREGYPKTYEEMEFGDSEAGIASAASRKPSLRFNNFEGRHYDYDDLEKKLLGWK